jgi:hypothetical protein
LGWRRHPECQVDHIVLGKGPPGGSWQVILRKLVIGNNKVYNWFLLGV